MYFEGNQEAPAEPVLGEGGEENNSAGMKGEGPAEYIVMTTAWFHLWIQRPLNYLRNLKMNLQFNEVCLRLDKQ